STPLHVWFQSNCASTQPACLDITLTCKYDIKYNGPTEACWGRGHLPLSGCSDQLLATDGHKVIEETRVSSRYQLKGRLDEGNVSLTIMNLTEEDAGVYGCRVEIYGPFNDEKHEVSLTVKRAPRLTTTPSSDTTSSSSDSPQTTATTPTAGTKHTLMRRDEEFQ
uniref:Ig-like domain-containing protein n=1 Tax=Oryzias melastigma TaxID=30732 RepID=A0A3B3BWA0_ORYME